VRQQGRHEEPLRNWKVILFRWFVAGGGTDVPFTTEAIDEIFKITLGLPREIVKVCDLALVSAFSKKHEKILPEDVRNSAKELHLLKDE
jgi:hypothetical protein